MATSWPAAAAAAAAMTATCPHFCTITYAIADLMLVPTAIAAYLHQ
jgi:hypothetical protein